MERTRLPIAVAVTAWLGVAVVLHPDAASAHARLVRSDPPRGASLKTQPSAVRLWLSEPIEPAYSRVAVTNEAGQPMVTSPAAVSPEDPKLLVLELPELPAGTYLVTFEVLSVDGHRVKQSFPFTIKGGAKPN
jgi:hypothetical protein